MGKIIPHFERVTNWSVVPPLSQNITLIMKCLCYGKNNPTLFKELPTGVLCQPFTKHYVDNEVVMLWGK